jgi:hypothetical protein
MVALSAVLAAGLTVAPGAAPGVAGAAAGPERTGEVRALTYNVAGLPEVLSGSEPSVNMPLISPLLNDYDLVLVQEDWAMPEPPPGPPWNAFELYHHLLVADVTHPYLSEPAPIPLGTDPARPTALLSDGLNRMSRFPFGELTRVMWPNCFGGGDTSDGGAGDCLAQKGFSVARTELAPGVEVDVYNLHAEAGNTEQDQIFHAEDFELLAEFIATYSADRAVIVGGDYNLHTDRVVHGQIFTTFLAETGLTDVCAVVDCGADLHRIDKFTFRSGGGITLEPLTHRFERDVFVRESDGAPLSDHAALAVDFRWTAPGVEIPDFTDLDEGHPFWDDIAWLLAEGIAEGYDDGTFRPGGPVSRQALAAFLFRAAGSPDTPGACVAPPFPDVPANHAFCEEIAWLATSGLVEGYGDGTFRPDAPVSRQAAAAVLFREAGSPTEAGACDVPPFEDVATTHRFCREVHWLAATGATEGYADGTFRPTAPVTRQAMAAFLHRLATAT